MKKRIAALLLAAVLCVGLCPSVFAAASFQDVKSDAWYYKDVTKAVELGLMNGKGGGLFKPSDLMTEAEALTLAVRLHQGFYPGTEDGKPEPLPAATGSQRWWEPYFDYAWENNIIPQDDWDQDVYYEYFEGPATRRNYVNLFARVLTPLMLAPVNSIEDGAIPDVGINDDGAAAVYAFYRAGILTGSDAHGHFNPDAYITRAEVATILVRINDDSTRKRFALGDGLSGIRTACKAAGKDCAVAFLGTSLNDASTLAMYRDGMDFLGSVEIVEQPGDESYLIVPADTTASIMVYEYVFNEQTGEAEVGKLLFTGEAGEPVIVQGNVSEIMPNLLVYIESSEGGYVAEFSPCLSGENGKLAPIEGVLDYTRYGEG